MVRYNQQSCVVTMKFLAIFLLTATVINAQTGNYLINSYDAAMELKLLYENEVTFYRGYLTSEAEDMGHYYTNLMAMALDVATTEEEGAALQSCVTRTAASADKNMIEYDYMLRHFEQVTRELHLSIFKILMDTNIKQEGAHLVYYYHDLYMEKMHEALSKYDYWLFDGWNDLLYLLWIDLYDELYYCINDVLSDK